MGALRFARFIPSTNWSLEAWTRRDLIVLQPCSKNPLVFHVGKFNF